MKPLPIYVGYDPRQPISYNVLCQSIFTNSSKPVTISPLLIHQLPIDRVGLTPFTYSRFLLPWLQNFEDGPALFLDSDMLVLGDIAELFDCYDPDKAVSVVKIEKRFEWASVMLFSCGHEGNRVLTPEYIDDKTQCQRPHVIDWLDPDLTDDSKIGELPKAWNHCVFYDKPAPAFLVHYTAGIPLFPETRGCEYTDEWMNEAQRANSAVSWEELMGRSVHVQKVAEWHKQKKAAEA